MQFSEDICKMIKDSKCFYISSIRDQVGFDKMTINSCAIGTLNSVYYGNYKHLNDEICGEEVLPEYDWIKSNVVVVLGECQLKTGDEVEIYYDNRLRLPDNHYYRLFPKSIIREIMRKICEEVRVETVKHVEALQSVTVDQYLDLVKKIDEGRDHVKKIFKGYDVTDPRNLSMSFDILYDRLMDMEKTEGVLAIGKNRRIVRDYIKYERDDIEIYKQKLQAFIKNMLNDIDELSMKLNDIEHCYSDIDDTYIKMCKEQFRLMSTTDRFD